MYIASLLKIIISKLALCIYNPLKQGWIKSLPTIIWSRIPRRCNDGNITPINCSSHIWSAKVFKFGGFFLIWANVGFSKTKNLTWFLIVSKHSFMIIEVVLCVIPYKSPHIIKILLLPNHANVKATLVCMRILFLIFVSFFNFKTRSKIVHKYSNVRRFTRIRFLNILSTNELRRLYSIYQPILSYSHKDLGVFIQPPSRVKQPPTSFWHFIHI